MLGMKTKEMKCSWEPEKCMTGAHIGILCLALLANKEQVHVVIRPAKDHKQQQ